MRLGADPWRTVAGGRCPRWILSRPSPAGRNPRPAGQFRGAGSYYRGGCQDAQRLFTLDDGDQNAQSSALGMGGIVVALVQSQKPPPPVGRTEAARTRSPRSTISVRHHPETPRTGAAAAHPFRGGRSRKADRARPNMLEMRNIGSHEFEGEMILEQRRPITNLGRNVLCDRLPPYQSVAMKTRYLWPRSFPANPGAWTQFE